MTTAENEKQGLTKFAISDSAIQELGTQYLGLTINGVEDKAGLATVHAARMNMRTHRLAVEKTRKGLKEESLAWGRAVDGEARRITGLMAPIEEHLTLEETRVTMAIKAEKERQAAELLATRMEQLKSVESTRHFRDVELMDDEEFRVAYWADHADFAARKITEAAEAKRKAEETARLAEQEAKLEKQRAEQEAEAKRIEAARMELEAEQAEARKVEDARIAAESEKLRLQKVELSRQAAEIAAQVREAEEEAARAKAIEEAEAHRLRVAPEVDQVREIARQVLAIRIPDISVAGPVLAILTSCSKHIVRIATNLETQTPNPRN